MHPILFQFESPEFLQWLLPDQVTVYTYGAMIAFGAVLAGIYTGRQAKNEIGLAYHETNNMVIIILIAAFVGGKLFFYLENPQFYFSHPVNMIKSPGKGFVFYGSLIFSLVSIIVFFKVKKIPMLMMLDIIAITTCIVHFFGRLGCFNAGCCYGHVHDGPFSVVFTNPVCMAKPLNTPLHPTQLYSAGSILLIMCFLLFMKSRKKFHGQIILLYIIMYSVARGIIEVFRGDLVRGFVIDPYLSHSQFIALVLLIIAIYFYVKLRKNKITENKRVE